MLIFLRCLALALIVATSAAVQAADLVYTPINPTFGGNPQNSSHLLAIAAAQKTATATDAPKTSSGSGSGTGGSSTQSNVDLFISQLEGRLLSALASQVTDAIFGQNPQDHGTITFGSTTVVFDRNPVTSSIDLTITNTETGEVTIISVPQLITN